LPPKASSPPRPSAIPPPMQTEIVESIPVRQQGQPVSAAPGQPPGSPLPTMQMPSYGADPKDNEDELDSILQAVNNRVKTPPAGPAKQPSKLAAKLKPGGERIKGHIKSSKPIGAIAMALSMAILLSAAAVFAYRQAGSHLSNQPGKVGTTSTASSTIQEAGGTLVRPSDLDDFSQALQTKLNSLNDSQDFNSNSLTDQTLGL
jgi:hypothetical protein